MATPAVEVEVDGIAVRVSNPDKVFFPTRGETKLDLVNYYLAVGEGALRGVFERPTVLKRFPDGALGEPFFQKRVPEKRPEWLETVRVTFPSGRSADELCPVDLAHIGAQAGALAAELLGAGRVRPHGRLLQLPGYFLKALLLAIVLKETPVTWRCVRRGP